MSKIKDIIRRVDRNKPNAFSEELKLHWISQLDGKIALDVMLMDVSEVHQFQYNFPEDLQKKPLVSFPHEDVYEHWLEANIDAQNGEYSRYQNSMEFYNTSYDNFVNWFLSRYEPGRGCGCQPSGTPSYYISAYSLAVKHGFAGDPEAWLASLSAYGLAVAQGFEGDLQAWLASLKGEKGDKGDPGAKLEIGEVKSLPAGSAATASITGTAEKPVLNLGLPLGTEDFENHLKRDDNPHKITPEQIGAVTATNAGLTALLKTGAMVLSPHQYGDVLPENGVEGQIFFLKV